MKITFAHKKLLLLYQTGRSTQYNKHIIQSFIDRVMFMSYAPNMQSIRAMKSRRLEQLQGKLKGKYSIRLNKQYRLIFSTNKDEIYTIIRIEHISKHYE